jgi:DNA-binding transcriptional MerR regulator
MPTQVMDDPLDAPVASAVDGHGDSSPVRVSRQASKPRREPAVDHGAEATGVRRLYTIAMMADVLGAPPAAVRHWARGGLIAAAKRAGPIEWFDFQQLVVGRTLARLLADGLSLREIDAKLAGLAPGGAGEAARTGGRIVVDGRRLSIRRGGLLLGAGGQMQFGFYVEGLHVTTTDGATGMISDPVRGDALRIEADDAQAVSPPTGRELLDLAADLEAAGEFVEAAEALRAFLQAEGPAAPVMFMLAELLYRSGDLTAARERYYATLELDADHLEARTSLGCVLAELGDQELALAALDGVLRQEPDYADAHWHVAGVLEACGRIPESRRHLRTFLALAPESPWATLARDRLR